VYVDDVVHAFDAVLHSGVDGQVYNIGTSFEVDMLTLARMIVMAMGLAPPGDDQAADEFIEFVEDRNINDRRCALAGFCEFTPCAPTRRAGTQWIAPACLKWDGRRRRRSKPGSSPQSSGERFLPLPLYMQPPHASASGTAA
jgi:hypothetical protein